ncbi:MAG: septum formation initiator family protein [Candidatus Marinimicrobia bacterium]|nr:septum formation initiator family protein [Candidatus Neomarinimicrobiota bacterium]
MIPGAHPSRNLTLRSGRPLSPLKKLLSIGIVTIVLTFIVVNRQGLIKLRQLQRDQQAMEEKLVRLQIETDQLESTRIQLEVDMAYIEQLAREKYRMVRRGEKIFRVVPRPTTVDNLPPSKG